MFIFIVYRINIYMHLTIKIEEKSIEFRLFILNGMILCTGFLTRLPSPTSTMPLEAVTQCLSTSASAPK